MSKRVLCKYFAHGACLKGEYCEFSHDWKDQANNVCTFYQRGACSYGSRCRYEHIKVNQAVKEPTVLPSIRIPAEPKSKSLVIDEIILPDSIPGASSTEDFSPVVNTSSDPWKGGSGYGIESETVSMLHSSVFQASDHPICAYAASGTCSQGDNCPQLHGDLCSTCGKHCLHPFRPEEREEHIKQCQHNHKRLQALRYSQEIECCVCLERVLSKAKPSERKFGILSECDHAFCVACIRSWRANTPSSGMDVNSTLRSCPICRKVSHFVIPSVIWYSNPEEKHEIVTNYKKKLSTIDCKYFDFGNSKCPFSTSCFYKHAYKDGRLEEVKLRHLGAADGSTVIAKEVRLSEFLATLHI